MMTRRNMIGLLAGTAPMLSTGRAAISALDPGGKRLGLGMHSYGSHWMAARNRHPKARFTDALEFLEYGHEIGAGGVQVGIGARDPDYTAKLRGRAEAHGMHLEAQSTLPRTESDLERFEAEVRTARDAGADVMRTAMLSGRRYETFRSAEDFRQFAERSWRSLTLAEPVVKKHRIRLAIENHKDWRVPELLDILRRISSEHVGVCIDTGNSIALLEDPMAVIEAYAPWAASTHIKDMGVEECADGFLLSEVPLGEGFLDFPKIVAILRRAAPQVRFNLEMITRDPLRIPCLTDGYWATLGSVAAVELAEMLGTIRRQASRKPLPRVADLNQDEKLAREDENVRKCLAAWQRLV